MDAKDLRTESALSDHTNNGSTKYSQSSAVLHCNRNKPYQDMGSNSLGKVDVQTARPCAVIGPDRIVPPPASDTYLKKNSLETWSNTDAYRRPPEYPHKITEYHHPNRNISPRQTFQENMQRIMVPPSYNSTKNKEDHNFPVDPSVAALRINKINVTSDTKYCDVPYNVNPLGNEQKNIRTVDNSVSNVNPGLARNATNGWHPASGNIRATKPYGVPDLYQYPEYSSCAGPRSVLVPRPHRTLHEEPGHVYPPEPFYHEANVRFKPYPMKERVQQARYDYLGNYSNPFHPPPPFPSPKYDLQKTIPHHPYPGYSQVPYKYLDTRMADPAMNGYQRQLNQQANFNSVPFRNQVMHPSYGHVPSNCVQSNKFYPYSSDNSVKSMNSNNGNKIYTEYENTRVKPYPLPETYYVNEMTRSHPHMKGQVLAPPSYPAVNMQHPMAAHPYYRKDNTLMKGYEYSPHYRNIDPTPMPLNSSALSRFTSQFSPNAIAISPADSNTSNDTAHTQGTSHEDCGYVSQSSSTSIRSIDTAINRFPTDMYGRYDYRYGPIKGPHIMSKAERGSTINVGSKAKKDIDVRQFLEMWNEGEDESGENNHKDVSSKISHPNDSIKHHESNNHEQLYVLGLVNVPSEELDKYEHIQKVSKLPENIKGYNSIELLNQFEEVTGTSNLNNFSSKPTSTHPTSRDFHVNMKNSPSLRGISIPPRPISPLDVESKISQSVIHKEVGCNFEIKPCSPKMLNVEIAASAQTVLGERLIEKINNPLIVPSPTHGVDQDRQNCNVTKHSDHSLSTDENLKAPSCNMISTQCNDPVRTNYSLQDLESNSGICLASLPRLDNDCELNFPEVNQQFINANKVESVITSIPKDLPTLDVDSPQMQQNSTTPDINHISFSNDSEKEISKLSRYRKLKKKNESDKIQDSNNSIMRKDSVIIKNPENTKNIEENIAKVFPLKNTTMDMSYSPINLTLLKENKALDNQSLGDIFISDIALDFSSKSNVDVPRKIDDFPKETKNNQMKDTNSKIHESIVESQHLKWEGITQDSLLADVKSKGEKSNAIFFSDSLLKTDLHNDVEPFCHLTKHKSVTGHSHESTNNCSAASIEDNNVLLEIKLESEIEKLEGIVESSRFESDENKYTNQDQSKSSHFNPEIGSCDSIDTNYFFEDKNLELNEKSEIVSNFIQSESENKTENRDLGLIFMDVVTKSDSSKNIDLCKNKKIIPGTEFFEEDFTELNDITKHSSEKLIAVEKRFELRKIYLSAPFLCQTLDYFKKELYSPRIQNLLIHNEGLCRRESENSKLTENVNSKTYAVINELSEDSVIGFGKTFTCSRWKEVDVSKKADINVNNDERRHINESGVIIPDNITNQNQECIFNKDSSVSTYNNVSDDSNVLYNSEHQLSHTQTDNIELKIESRYNTLNNDAQITADKITPNSYEIQLNDSKSNNACETVPNVFMTPINNDIELLSPVSVQNVNSENSVNSYTLIEFAKDDIKTGASKITENCKLVDVNDIIESSDPGIELESFKAENDITELSDSVTEPIIAQTGKPQISEGKNIINLDDITELNNSVTEPISSNASETKTTESSRADKVVNVSSESNYSFTDAAESMKTNDFTEPTDSVTESLSTGTETAQSNKSKSVNDIIEPKDSVAESVIIETVEIKAIENSRDRDINDTVEPNDSLPEPVIVKIIETEIAKPNNNKNVNDITEPSDSVTEPVIIETIETETSEINRDEEVNNIIDPKDGVSDLVVAKTIETETAESDSERNAITELSNYVTEYVFEDHNNLTDIAPPSSPTLEVFLPNEVLCMNDIGSIPDSPRTTLPTEDATCTEIGCINVPTSVDICNNDKLTEGKATSSAFESLSDSNECEELNILSSKNVQAEEDPVKDISINMSIGLPEHNNGVLSEPIKIMDENKVADKNEELKKVIISECPSRHIGDFNKDHNDLNIEPCNQDAVKILPPVNDLLVEEKPTCLEETSEIVLNDGHNTCGSENSLYINNTDRAILTNDNVDNIVEGTSSFEKCNFDISNTILTINDNNIHQETICASDDPKVTENDDAKVIKYQNNCEKSNRKPEGFLKKIENKKENICNPAQNMSKVYDYNSGYRHNTTGRKRDLNKTLKRSLSDSALDTCDLDLSDKQDEIRPIWPNKRKKCTEPVHVMEPDFITENYCNIMHHNRRNSISSVYNEENVSYCIFIDNNTVGIITEDEDEADKICFAEITEDCIPTEVLSDENIDSNSEIITMHMQEETQCEYSDSFVIDGNEDEKTFDETWVDDVACVETVVSDDIAEDVVVSASSSPRESDVSDDESNNESGSLEENCHADKVKYIYGDKMCTNDAQLVETLYRTPQMDVNKTLSYQESQLTDNCVEYYDTESLKEVLSESPKYETVAYKSNDDKQSSRLSVSVCETIEDNVEIFHSGISSYLEANSEIVPNLIDTDYNIEETHSPKLLKTQDDTVHSCESSVDKDFSYTESHNNLKCTVVSSSPEVSSTTPEERNSSIFLKITPYGGSRVAQVNNISNIDSKRNTVSCKYTEKKDYTDSKNKLSPRPLITKAAQKYIPPIKETLQDLKVKLHLPQHSLVKLKQLKVAKESKLNIPRNRIVKMNSTKDVPKKIKPKFEDVLKSIDEIQFKMLKEKSKKSKKFIPKVVIKKTGNGSHYTSSNKEIYNPDLTGRKWQPWVFIEKNRFIDKMAISKKSKAIFHHRKETYVLAETFKKYKSYSNLNHQSFIMSQPKLNDTSTGHLKYTIRLKHNCQ